MLLFGAYVHRGGILCPWVYGYLPQHINTATRARMLFIVYFSNFLNNLLVTHILTHVKTEHCVRLNPEIFDTLCHAVTVLFRASVARCKMGGQAWQNLAEFKHVSPKHAGVRERVRHFQQVDVLVTVLNFDCRTYVVALALSVATARYCDRP